MIYDTITSPIYDDINLESPSFLLVKNNNKVGLIDFNAITILEIEYDEINTTLSTLYGWEPFQNKFYVKKNGKWGIVGCKNYKNQKQSSIEILLLYQFDSFFEMGRDYIITETNKKFQLYSHRNLKFISKNSYLKIYNDWIYYPEPFILFKVQNKNKENVYIGENGTEFFSD